MQVAVSIDSAASSTPTEPPVTTMLDLPARATRVQRRDLTVAIATASDAKPMGTIRGRLTNASGEGFPNARVVTDGVPETRSDSSGAFILRDVPAGSRTIEFLAIGATPLARTVDVIAGDTTNASAQLERVTTLERVDVRASVVTGILRDFEDRKRMGFGYVRDSSTLARVPTMSTVLRQFPSVVLGNGRDPDIKFRASVSEPYCQANIFIDRHRQTDSLTFYALHPDEIAWVEVYPRRFTVPQEFMGGRQCGVIAVFTKRSIAR
jgi:hypothetical protein